MTIEALAESLPAYANDIKLNLTSALRQTELTPQQFWGTLVVSAMASKNSVVLKEILESAQTNLSAAALEAAKGAAALMGMNNIYYRFLHLSSNERYKQIPARLRMNFIKTHGVEAVDFELWCLAASAINGCGMCVDSHESKLREQGLGEEVILAAVRIASVVHAAATAKAVEVA